MSVRYAAVSGSFYPAHSQDLAREVGSFINAATTVTEKPPKIIVVPHAHYSFSGHIAAEAFHALIDHQHQYKKVILLGPAHCCCLQGIATSANSAFETPLGTIDVAKELVDQIDQIAGVHVQEDAHTMEYSIEVQLPFLQTVLSEFSLVPLVVGDATPKQLAEVLRALWGGDETLIVISSDMSHHLYDNDARHKDADTVEKIHQLKPTLNSYDACGYRALNAALVLAENEGLKAELICQCNSSVVTGNRDNVTGYASFMMV
ncbi:AmmeMemoRadiSam system protein B [Reinekea marinisedimentorum]|nr:AmmeMemoRadiSam system protein B [Reinekea marinisedimentorum]